MALTVQTSGNVEVPTLSMLVCGPGGAGKTRLSSTFPDPFYISAEAGLLSVRDRDVPYAEVETREDILGVKAVLEQPTLIKKHIGRPVQTVVIDTFDEVLGIYKRSRVVETKKAFAIQDWDWLAEQLKGLVRGLRKLPMNLVITCHLKDESDGETGEMWFEPALQGQIKPWLPTAVDIATVINASSQVKMVDGEKQVVTNRWLQTYPDRQHKWIKDRFGHLPPQLPVDFEGDYQRIFEAAYKGLEAPDLEARQEQAAKDLEDAASAEAEPEVKPEPEPEAKPKAKSKPVDPKPEKADEKSPPEKGSTGPVDKQTGEIPPAPKEEVPQDEEPAPRAESPLRESKGDGDTCDKCGEAVSPNRRDLSKLKFKGAVYCDTH